ncbi:hypothetical protein M378DRAFT_1039391 [Amanita muscaria Koide BX008]|uniref:Uncharacterized protein n=1 Tax=Amanita muscaria (strain Koide BX008) TaxID=946122 RepID=A0A0C2WHH5_AMAMK|nr:hypothetical protein M378DRAFT_1039391 [Amanita muscaria Koide BX008]
MTHEEDARLWNVCSECWNLINQSAGFVTETRPLKLHCTILNTSHRRPRGNIPFSYSDILASDVCRNVLVPAPASGVVGTTARVVNFGTHDVGRVELWEMGSLGPNNEYVSCGGIEI